MNDGDPRDGKPPPTTPDGSLSSLGLRLRVVASDEGRTGEIVEFPAGRVRIGRARDCDFVLTDESVSRHHALIERVRDGIRVRDLESGSGVWVEHREIKGDELLGPGGRFQIGSTLFEWLELPALMGGEVAPDRTVVAAAMPPPVKDQTVYGMAVGFTVRIVEGEDAADSEIVVEERWATVGRAEDCTIVLTAPDVTRQHCRIDLLSSGFRVTDLGSANGTWIDERLITRSEVLEAGQRFRLGAQTLVECRLLRPVASAEHRIDVTVCVALPDQTKLTRIEDEGELVETGSHEPFLLDDTELVWQVISGGVDLYTVDLDKGQPVGTHSHFLEVLPGQCLLGFDFREMSSGFLAVARQGTQLRKLSLARFRELAAETATAGIVGTLVDTWILGLSKALGKDLVAKDAKPILVAGEEVALGKGRCSSADGVVWLDLWGGSVQFNDLERPQFRTARALLPVTPESWIMPLAHEFGELKITPARTADAIDKPELWEGVEAFHKLVLRCEFIAKGLRMAAEAARLRDRKVGHFEAMEEAKEHLAWVMGRDAVPPDAFLFVGDGEPVLRACQIVGGALGIAVKSHPTLDEDSTYEEKVTAMARASGFRTRAVALRGEWWKKDQGPYLGQLEETKAPVAILPKSPSSYEYVDPQTGERARINTESADLLSPFAFAFYRPFPTGPLGVRDIMRFAIRGLARDVRLLIAMGILLGLFGTVAPFLTGRVFDAAIPQADRSMLLVFGSALLVSALASAMFKLTQGIATLRVQGRMESSVQAALWDRLIGLPTGFFRSFSAGDLADRAAGIDAIQNLLSGAGIGAILGSFSALFYVFQMYLYDFRLAVVAVLLTLSYIGSTTLANYVQLRHQRLVFQVRGKIAGLVLNLISGVSKLRIAGAENHAFRIWAKHFAEQKRIGFRVGQIQNVMAVFNSVFPVLSSMTIFFVMLKAQESSAESGATPLTTGDFIAFNAAYGLFIGAMQALGDASLNLLRAVPIYERLAPIVTARPEADETKASPGKIKGGIQLENVSFRYDKEGPYVIDNLSLEIEPGELVAFVGGSGCGKSTLLRLLLGFEQPEKGVVCYDGQDLAGLDLRMLREQLGVVLQTSRVFPAEIYRNIVSLSSRTEQEAWDAAEKAGLKDDIIAMPMGMHTYVSEGGGTLSGGQRQRLMIARAIVNRPKVLFLDEATSALDNRTQEIVTQSLDAMDATRIVIAHRLSTIINADRICFLEKGRIAEEGTYQELMALDGLFAQLARRQME